MSLKWFDEAADLRHKSSLHLPKILDSYMPLSLREEDLARFYFHAPWKCWVEGGHLAIFFEEFLNFFVEEWDQKGERMWKHQELFTKKQIIEQVRGRVFRWLPLRQVRELAPDRLIKQWLSAMSWKPWCSSDGDGSGARSPASLLCCGLMSLQSYLSEKPDASPKTVDLKCAISTIALWLDDY